MYKTSKKAAAALIALGLITGAALTLNNTKAGEVYDDTTIGISSALDRYVESVQEASAQKDEQLADNKKKDTEKVTKSKKKSKKKKEEKKEETSKYPEFENKCLTNVNDFVNIRTEADEASEVVGTLAASGVATVIEKGSEWTQIESGSCKGYIKNEFLVYGDDAGEYAAEHCAKQATVTADSLNVRQTADEGAECVTMVAYGESYIIVDTTDKWVGIAVNENTYGYVSSDYVDVSYVLVEAVSVEEAEQKRQAEEEEQKRKEEEQQQEEEPTTQESVTEQTEAETTTEQVTESEPVTEEPTTEEQSYEVPSSGSTGVDLANFALQFVGNPYVYGGSSLTNGADCSGFVMAVYAEYGYSLPHSAGMQSGYGSEVSLSELEPGDLLFYGSYSIEHVAIYVGGGMIVHASTAETGIKTSNYDYRTPCKAVRIIGQ